MRFLIVLLLLTTLAKISTAAAEHTHFLTEESCLRADFDKRLIEIQKTQLRKGEKQQNLILAGTAVGGAASGFFVAGIKSFSTSEICNKNLPDGKNEIQNKENPKIKFFVKKSGEFCTLLGPHIPKNKINTICSKLWLHLDHVTCREKDEVAEIIPLLETEE